MGKVHLVALGFSICKLFRRRLKEVFYSPQKDILKPFSTWNSKNTTAFALVSPLVPSMTSQGLLAPRSS